MKMPVALLLLLALSFASTIKSEEVINAQCEYYKPRLKPRPHSVSILEFCAVGDGKTLNTVAFQNAIFYLKSFADKGGAKLYVPPGKWLTGSFNLTSHLTLFIAKGAIILGSQNLSHWEVVEPLPSYGRGIDVPGRRYQSLINGYMLQDVLITGDNGIIDGQGLVWWHWLEACSLNYSRPHLVEFISSENIVVSNLTFLNAPAYNIHPVYCSNVLVHNISVAAPPQSPYTAGIVPDSSKNVCIENSSIEMGHDAIALKSGWDEYGIAYGRPTRNVCIQRVRLRSTSGSCIAFGSEMSGGISNVQMDEVHLHNGASGIEFLTTKGRGGYIKRITLSNIKMENINVAFGALGDYGSHPDGNFDPNALSIIHGIVIHKVMGTNITIAGNFSGIQESPFTSICLVNVFLRSTTHGPRWFCSNVVGFSDSVIPKPCPELETSYSNSSSSCHAMLDSSGKFAEL